MGRKKGKSSTVDGNDSFDEELAKSIYGKQEFEAPIDQGLSTLLEAEDERPVSQTQAGRPARSSKAGLLPQPRKITSQPFYIQDQDKDVLRKKQVAKLFKGRRKDKPKWKGLSAKKESFLLKLIEEKPNTSDESESETEDSPSRKPLLPFIINNSEDLNSRVNGIENSSRKRQEEMHQNIKDADAFLGPLGFSDDEDEDEGSSAFKNWRLASEDKENVAKNKDRRKSKITKVRRSSRLFKGVSSSNNPQPSANENETNYGSVYTSVEITEKKVGRKSMLVIQPLNEHMDQSL